MMLMNGACVGTTPTEDVSDPVERSRMVVEAQLEVLDQVIGEQVRSKLVMQAIGERVEAEAARPFAARVNDGLRYSTVFQREYVGGAMEPVFADARGLTPRGQEVVAILQEAERHGVEAETFHRSRIEARQEWMEQEGEPEVGRFRVTPREVEALVEVVAEELENGHEEGEGWMGRALRRIDEQGAGGEALGRVREYAAEEALRFEAWAGQVAELELWVADGALRYAREMRHGNLKRVDWRMMREAGGSTELILGRMQQTLEELHEASDEEGVAAVMRALEPGHAQYRALFEAAGRYREIASAGGWEPVRRFEVKLGAKSEAVEALRERLEKEGITARPEEVDGEYDPQVVDEALIAAIKVYQQTHQFSVDGEPTPGFWRSVNKPVEERIEQMELNMQRWRESYLGDEEDYLLVNIPGFFAEVVEGGDVKMRFSVVVGRNNRRCEEGKWVYPNQTPSMMSMLDQVVFNPSWWVPSRLVEEQIQPKMEENPDYMEENGFEEMVMADGRTVVRQLPGPENALGRVKFLFPNEHNVYLHDTPQEHYFDYEIRSYSSGCVRVAEPLGLAQYLMEREGRSDLVIEEIISADRTRAIDMQEELAVVIEYYTVWVDEEGRPNFLADIYDKDRRHFSDDPEEFDRCQPRRKVPEREIEGDEDAPDDVAEDAGP